MTKRRSHGQGSIQERGERCWRIRYRVDGKRFTETFHGLKSEAQRRLTELLAAGNAGNHIAPDRITLAQWLPRWMALLERKTEGEGDGDRKRGRLVNSRTVQRYEELMRLHVLPAFGDTPLQKIRGTHIDEFYISLEEHLAPCTVHHVHAVLRACLNMAVRKRLIATNPATEAEAPSPGESDHGVALEEHELMKLVKGFEATTLHTIVATAAFTGARRNEILALRWSDFSIEKKTLTLPARSRTPGSMGATQRRQRPQGVSAPSS
jgi:integrase